VPVATGTVNLISCLIAGVISGLVVSGQIRMSLTMRTFVFVGRVHDALRVRSRHVHARA
jgi:hypothetical protein